MEHRAKALQPTFWSTHWELGSLNLTSDASEVLAGVAPCQSLYLTPVIGISTHYDKFIKNLTGDINWTKACLVKKKKADHVTRLKLMNYFVKQFISQLGAQSKYFLPEKHYRP